jgi:membrane dipeptidase
MKVAKHWLDKVALERALVMVELLRRQIERHPQALRLIREAGDLDEDDNRVGLIIGLEGADPIGVDLDLLDVFYRLGLRCLGLAWNNRNVLADGKRAGRQPGGLSTLGEEAVLRANRLGMVVDVAHLADLGVTQVLELSKAPVIHSHTSLRKGWARAETLRAIADRGGVVGVIFYGMRDLADIVQEIVVTLDALGEDHVGLGSDLFGPSHENPMGVDIGSLPDVARALGEAGVSRRIVSKVMGGNYLRVLKASLPQKS